MFTFAGTLLCIIPGLVVAAMYKFTYLFIMDKRMDFWPAMQASHAIVKQDYFGFTMFLLALALINILGALCCIVGVFVSIPVTIAAITVRVPGNRGLRAAHHRRPVSKARIAAALLLFAAAVVLHGAGRAAVPAVRISTGSPAAMSACAA